MSTWYDFCTAVHLYVCKKTHLGLSRRHTAQSRPIKAAVERLANASKVLYVHYESNFSFVREGSSGENFVVEQLLTLGGYIFYPVTLNLLFTDTDNNQVLIERRHKVVGWQVAAHFWTMSWTCFYLFLPLTSSP